ncbi:MAG: NUDIX domain-containing protein [Pedobacter sp.]|nr:NUDIX domain-containing protein [Pedobacter sp.]MDQ8052136.1 NUDIX domain-containing protein [Pedobacter sp.]
MSYFNVRVYGLLISPQNEVLISDEFEYGMNFTKFPGGGLELGEGLIDALKREFMEECNVEVEVTGHFYTTDFYEKSAFNESQVISIYYLVKELHPLQVAIKHQVFDFEPDSTQSFRWVPIDQLNESDLTFKTDQTVARLLKKSITA